MKRVTRNILTEKIKSNHKNAMISKVQQISQETRVEIKNALVLSKHEQIQMEKAYKQNRKVNRRKKKTGNDKEDERQDNSRG